MDEVKKFSLVKPTVNTPFHIDFDWWKQHDNNWRIYLQSCLCADHKLLYSETTDVILVDWVDPNTAEVHSVDGLQHILMSHCAIQPEFLTNFTTLVDSTFRILLANGNTPLTPKQLEEKIGKPAETILRTLSGLNIYKGIRPFQS